jgi:chromosome segregation ATPase
LTASNKILKKECEDLEKLIREELNIQFKQQQEFNRLMDILTKLEQEILHKTIKLEQLQSEKESLAARIAKLQQDIANVDEDIRYVN